MKLIFDAVTASYRGKTVLEQVSFSAERGTITALVGRNGAGKTTLVSCLTGEKPDYSGAVLLDTQDIRGMSPMDRARHLACMPQTLPRPHVTVRELVAFGRTPYTSMTGFLSSADREAVDRAIYATGMEPFAAAFVDELSGGERKKAFFAMTLAQDTPVVVLDEPTAHLDAVSRFAFLSLIQRLCRDTGKTFFLVLHELPEVLRCADRIVALHEKRVSFAGDAEAFLAAEIPQACFQVCISGDRSRGYAVRPL